VSRKKLNPLKILKQCVNLQQIKYILHRHSHNATFISNDVLKFLENKLLRQRNQIVNKIAQILDYTAQLRKL